MTSEDESGPAGESGAASEVPLGPMGLSVSFADLLSYIVPGAALILCMLLFELSARSVAPRYLLETGWFPLTRSWTLVQGFGRADEVDDKALRVTRKSVHTSTSPESRLRGTPTDAVDVRPEYTANGNGPSTLGGVLLTVALLIVTYICGHLVGATASILLDRLFVGKGLGYPYRILLQLPGAPRGSFRNAGAAFWRGAVAWGAFYLLFRSLEKLLLFAGSIRASGVLAGTAAFCGGMILLAVLLKSALDIALTLEFRGLSKEQEAVRRKYGLPPGDFAPKRQFADRSIRDELAERVLGDWRRHIIWFLETLWAGVFDFFSIPLTDTLNSRDAFSAEFVERWHEAFFRRFGQKAAAAGTTAFWFAYGYGMERSRRSHLPILGWLRYYVFARNLACSFILSFVFGLLWLCVNERAALESGGLAISGLRALMLIYLALGAMLLVRYYHLYASYFTKNVLRLFLLVK